MQQQPRPLGKAGHAVFRNHAYGEPSGDERIFYFQIAVEDGVICPVDENFCYADAHFFFLAGRIFRFHVFQYACGDEFPHVHS